MPEVDEVEVNINPEDVEMKTARASGAGMYRNIFISSYVLNNRLGYIRNRYICNYKICDMRMCYCHRFFSQPKYTNNNYNLP